MNKKVFISIKGNQTIAVLTEDGKEVKRGVAKCSPEDVFDFSIGAMIALKRLFLGEAPSEIKFIVGHKYLLKPYNEIESHCGVKEENWDTKPIELLEVYDDFIKARTTKGLPLYFLRSSFLKEVPEEKKLEIKIGHKYFIKPYDKVKIHKGISEETWNNIRKECVLVESICGQSYFCKTCYCGGWFFAKEAFDREDVSNSSDNEREMMMVSTHFTNESYGKVGVLTKYKDVDGKPLCIGDTVTLTSPDGHCYGECSIVGHNGKDFVMGICVDCDGEKVLNGWKIKKNRSYTDIKNNEVVDSIKYIKVSE